MTFLTRHTRTFVAGGIATFAVGAVAVAGVTLVSGQVSPDIIIPPAFHQSSPASPVLSSATPIAVAADSGVTVSVLSVDAAKGQRTVHYTVAYADSAFGTVLGVPRILNPDGSIVIPSAYGDLSGTSPASPSDKVAESAIFDETKIAPGAKLVFGPFFETLPEGVNVSGSAAELRAGKQVVIDGEPFVVTLQDNGDMHAIVFHSLAKQGTGTVVPSHPRSVVSVTVDGTLMQEVHGSNSFPSRADLSVYSGDSRVDFTGVQTLPASADIAISVDSIGVVVSGKWELAVTKTS